MKPAALLFALLALGCGAVDESVTPAPRPSEGSRWITDAGGRAIVLRGMNVSGSAKSDPLRSPNIGDEDIERIARRWGFDFARYLVFWDALEPEPGKIDDAYIDRIASDVERLGAAGVRVMLDMHQDVYAAQFCCDGAPPWAVRDDGQPFELQDLWALNYQQPAVVHAFDNFWNATGPHADLQQHYAAAWKALATRFADDPYVIGYDLMNEPYAGSDFDALEALTRVAPDDGGPSKVFDETKLGPFHQRMVDAIRTVDTEHWIFFEPRYGAPANGSPSYLPVLEDPREGERRVVFAPHLYSSGAEATGAYADEDETVALWEQQRMADLASQQAPVLIGEWWAFAWSAPNAERFAKSILEMADRMGIGWAYWSYGADAPGSFSLHAVDGTDNPSADIVVRPYPRVIAGEPISWSYDATSRELDLVFERKAGVTGATELFIPEARVYPNGWDIEVDTDPAGRWSVSFDAVTGVASVMVDPATRRHHVHVAPKP